MNNNTSSTQCGHYERTGDFGKYTIVALYVVVATITLFGNTMMLLVVVWNKSMQTFTNLLLCNCAASDLLVIFPALWDVVDILKYDGRWVLGQFMCSFLYISIYLTVGVSILTLMVISIDRYFVVLLPYHKKLSKQILWCIIPVIWLTAFVISSPAIFIQKVVMVPEYGNVCIESWPSPFDQIKSPKYFTVTLFVVYYVIPLGMMSFIYVAIGRKLLSNADNVKKTGKRKIEQSKKDEEQKKSLTKNSENRKGVTVSVGNDESAETGFKLTRNRFDRSNVIKLLISLVSVFAVCWLPVFLLQFILYFHPKYVHCIQLVPEWAYAVVYLIQYSNSAINPILYFTFSTVYRKGFYTWAKSVRFSSNEEDVEFRESTSRRKMTIEANI